MKPTPPTPSKQTPGPGDALQLQVTALQEQVQQLQTQIEALKSFTVDHNAKTITIADANGNKIVLGPLGISLQSPSAISLSGLNVTANAQVGVTLKGNATAELSASGQTTIRGAMVMIN